MKALLVARREPQGHLNGAPGKWWCEYRLVRREGDEPGFEGRGGMYDYALEQRYCHERDSEYCHAPTHDGTWKSYGGEATAIEAIQLLGDTGWCGATSLHPSHGLSVELLKLQRICSNLTDRRSQGEQEKRQAELKEEAQQKYEQLLKSKRIHSAAKRGEAPHRKVEACREEAVAWLNGQLRLLSAEMDSLLCKEAEFGERISFLEKSLAESLKGF